MLYKVGDNIIVAMSLDDPKDLSDQTITKVGKDTVQCGSPENVFYIAFIWPAKYRNELQEICRTRQALKKAYDDSMKLVYELKNKISQEG